MLQPASGMSVLSVCEEYEVKKQTVSDKKKTKNKDKLIKFAASNCVDFTSSKSGLVRNHKHMKMGKDQLLDVAVLKRYAQYRPNGIKCSWR